MRMSLPIMCALVLPAVVSAQAAAGNNADRAAVRAAVLDYVEGFYQGDSTRIVRSVRPEVIKFGFYVPRDSVGYTGEPMSFTQMHAFANNVKRRNRPAPADAPKEIEIFDVQDQTAAAKLTAWWGTDYFHLARYDGKWMIVHVLWQSPPRRAG